VFLSVRASNKQEWTVAEFVVECETPRSTAEAWARLTDWPRHGRYVPLTSIAVTTTPPNGVGTVFVARTGIGRLGFDDPMEIVAWDPPTGDRPGRCRIEKRGRVMLGWAELRVRPTASGAHAQWREEITVARLPHATDRVTAAASTRVFGRVLRRLLED
jgi:hypothetical protein